jgi:hypothetical protein
MRHVIWPALLAGAVLLPGCAREPQSGEYRFERVGEIRGDCNLGDQMKGYELDQNATVTVQPDGRSMTITRQGKEVTCVMDGNNFDCTFMDDTTESKDATIRKTLKANGTWITDRMLEGTMSYAASCTGVDCVEKETSGEQFCNAEWDITGRLSQPGQSLTGEEHRGGRAVMPGRGIHRGVQKGAKGGMEEGNKGPMHGGKAQGGKAPGGKAQGGKGGLFGGQRGNTSGKPDANTGGDSSHRVVRPSEEAEP